MNHKDQLLTVTRSVFALQGYEGVSMRTIAKKANVAQSLLYYHFSNKDDLLRQMYDMTREEIGMMRLKQPLGNDFEQNLKQRIAFQLEYAEYVVTILKYYFHYRSSFPKHNTGYIPLAAYKHIEEVLSDATSNHGIIIRNIQDDAQVITHAINGFVMEYFPAELTRAEKKQLIRKISAFLLKAYNKGGDSK